MPTWATGRSIAERASRRVEQRGFTLLELLVALLIVGVLAGSFTFSMPQRGAHLGFEADRLARLLTIAREEALLRASPVRLESGTEGFQFLVWRERRWQIIDDDPVLRPRRWEAPTRVLIERADGAAVAEFGREPLDVAFRIRLHRDHQSALIESDGLGAIRVR